MTTSTISETTPLPVFITNNNSTAKASLPDIFKEGNRLKGQSLGSPRFVVEVKKVQGEWIRCKYDGDYVFDDVWIHVPSLAYLWSEESTSA